MSCGQIFRYFGAKYGADLIEFLTQNNHRKSAKLYRKIVKENWGGKSVRKLSISYVVNFAFFGATRGRNLRVFLLTLVCKITSLLRLFFGSFFQEKKN